MAAVPQPIITALRDANKRYRRDGNNSAHRLRNSNLTKAINSLNSEAEEDEFEFNKRHVTLRLGVSLVSSSFQSPQLITTLGKQSNANPAVHELQNPVI